MRHTAALVAAIALTVALAGCATTTENADPTTSTSTEPTGARYVNLGDSYSAGTGVAPLVENSNFLCQRSSRNFAHVIAERRGLDLTDVSCAGAQTTDLTAAQYDGVPAQLDALGSATQIVTLMLGGNDDDTFAGAISKCGEAASSDPTGSPCRDQYGDSLIQPIDETIYPALVAGLGKVRDDAPNAKVLIAGYPWILPATTGCYPTMRVATGDVGYLRDLEATLNNAVQRAAARAGATYVDMSERSEGHDACAPAAQRWIEPQVGSTSRVTVHPNARGQQAIADAVLTALDR